MVVVVFVHWKFSWLQTLVVDKGDAVSRIEAEGSSVCTSLLTGVDLVALPSGFGLRPKPNLLANFRMKLEVPAWMRKLSV